MELRRAARSVESAPGERVTPESEFTRFVLGAGPASVRRLFEMTGLTERLTFVEPRAGSGGEGEPGGA